MPQKRQIYLDYCIDLIEAFVWTLCSAATVATCGRLFIRWSRKLARVDDLFNGLALACLIAFVSLSQLKLNADAYPDSEYLRYGLAVDMLAWMTLYLVKASFLAFYWSLFRVSTSFRRAWWAISVYTFFTFWPLFLSQLWKCGNPLEDADEFACLYSSEVSFDIPTRIAGLALALHVSSDCLLLALPMMMLKKLQMSKAQKISVASVFALVVVDIITGITRNAAIICIYNDNPVSEVCETVASTMSVCEPSLAVFICALPAYRVLLPNSNGRKNQRNDLHQHLVRRADAVPHISSITLDTETVSLGNFQQVQHA